MAIRKINRIGYANYSLLNQQKQVFDRKKINGNIIDVRESQTLKTKENSPKNKPEAIKHGTQISSK